jgi:putative membrane protein insertion efficiency factor
VRAVDAESDGSRPGAPTVVSRIARAVVVAPIVVYRRVVSPALPQRCKYEPTCSHYAVDAVQEYGILRGLVLAVWRLLRCNPWSYGGYDPVEDQRVFKVGPGGS